MKLENEIEETSSSEEHSYYCRKCMKNLKGNAFYNSYDGNTIDSSGKFSVCKSCIQKLYDYYYEKLGSMEKTVHRLCQALNVAFSNEAMDATKAHINTLLEGGKNVNAIFSIYIMKLVATKKSMTKDGTNDFQYEDVGVIFTEKQIDTSEIPIPEEVVKFWGRELSRGDIEFLETEYVNFKNTHKADTYAEIVLLKQVCYTMLDIKKARAQQDDTEKLVKELQSLMQKLAISPNVANAQAANKGIDTFGLWIADIEQNEPAQWLKSDPRGDMYRDVGNVEEYFQRYIVRPLKNFIQGSKDFNVDDKEMEESEFDPEEVDNFSHIDDGETEG